MVIYEKISDTLVKAYSDQGMMLKQDGTGALYPEAIDPVSAGRTYTETDTPIDSCDEEELEEGANE